MKKFLFLVLSIFFISTIKPDTYLVSFDFDNQADAERMVREFVLPAGCYLYQPVAPLEERGLPINIQNGVSIIDTDDGEIFRVTYCSEDIEEINIDEALQALMNIFNKIPAYATLNLTRLRERGMRDWILDEIIFSVDIFHLLHPRLEEECTCGKNR